MLLRSGFDRTISLLYILKGQAICFYCNKMVAIAYNGVSYKRVVKGMGYRTRRIMNRMNYVIGPRKRKFRFSLFLLFAFVLLGGTFFVFETAVRPPLISLTTARLNQMANQLVNESILEELNKEDLQYEDFIQIERDSSGNVKSVNSNTMMINYVKSNFAQSINTKINETKDNEIGIPIGNLTGLDIFAGRGYRIPVKIEPANNVKVDFKSEFSSAGINQTKHEVVAQIDVKMSAVMPMGTVNTDLSTSIPLVQTVIVGEVPESLTGIIGTDSNHYLPYIVGKESNE